MIGVRLQPLRDVVFVRIVVVAIDLEAAAVVLRQHRFDEVGDRVAPEAGRHVTEAQAPAGRVIESGRRYPIGRWHLPAPGELEVRPMDRRRIERGRVVEREQQAAVGADVIRLEGERLTVVGEGLVGFALRDESHGQIIMGIRKFGAQGNCQMVMPDGIVDLAFCRERNAQVVVRLGVVWFERQRAPAACRRAIGFAQRGKREAQVVVGIGESGVERERAFIAGDGPVQPAL